MVKDTLSVAHRSIYRRYSSLALPRHTSYPIAPFWKENYGPADFHADLSRSRDQKRPLSLYVHIPYCEKLCYFCACTKEIVPTSKRAEFDPAESLLKSLEIEADRFADLVGSGQFHQVHLGGGSPTFLTPRQLERLWSILKNRFSIAATAEIAVEIDPRITTLEHLQTLRGLGFGRVSLGIQDFALQVQQAINRVQPFELVEKFVGWCRSEGFESINFDLIYGLPFQTIESMSDTLEKTIALEPDRIAFYRLAVIPEIFRWQNVFQHADLPAGDFSLDLNLLAIGRFEEAGYEFIGLDHFAKPTEALAQARDEGSLHRTFQGMTTGKNLDVLGMGPSAISQLHDAYAQNHKTSGDWQERIATDFATLRGLHLSGDDLLRRELMQQLYGYGTIEKRVLEKKFEILFDDYFSDELTKLGKLIEEGIVIDEADRIRLTAPLGRLLVRVVGSLFDPYLPPNAYCEGLAAHQSSKVG